MGQSVGKSWTKGLTLLAALVLSVGSAQAASVTPFNDLAVSGANTYSILALGGVMFLNSGAGYTLPSSGSNSSTNVTIKNSSNVLGLVGVGPKGNILMNSSILNGNLNLDVGGVETLQAGASRTGVKNQDAATDALLNAAITAVMTAYEDGIKAPNNVESTVAFPNSVVAGQTVTGTSGTVNVLKLSQLTLSGESSDLILNCSGTCATNTYFIINVNGAFTLAGGADILLGAGLSAGHVLFDVTGCAIAVTGCTTLGTVLFGDGNGTSTVNGIVLAPFRDITLNTAIVNGEIASGSLLITLDNSKVIPEPGTILIFTTGLAALGARFRRRKSV